MSDRPRDNEKKCEWFLEQLEELPVESTEGTTPADWMGKLPTEAQEHAAQCASCEEALEDFAETRAALEGMKEGMPAAGPWFTARVMAAIRAKEEEIEEKKEGVWIGVRRLAPRLAVFAAVLLVAGGTWAFQVRRTEQARGTAMRPAESLFEATPSAPVNDDILVLASAREGNRR